MLHISAEKQSCNAFKSVGSVAYIKFGSLTYTVCVEQIVFSENFRAIDCSFISRINKRNSVTHKVSNCVTQKRIVSAAENEGVNACFLEFGKISSDDKPYNLIVTTNETVFNKRNKKRTRLLINLIFRIKLFKTELVAVARNSCGSADNSDFTVLCFSVGNECGRVYNTRVWN